MHESVDVDFFNGHKYHLESCYYDGCGKVMTENEP